MIRILYVTAPSVEEARCIGNKLLQKKLAACVNVFPQGSSLYWWEGAIEESTETVFLVKTEESLVPRATEEIKASHSYQEPCILELPVVGGSEGYLEWLKESLS